MDAGRILLNSAVTGDRLVMFITYDTETRIPAAQGKVSRHICDTFDGKHKSESKESKINEITGKVHAEKIDRSTSRKGRYL